MANAKAKTPAAKTPAFDLAKAVSEWLSGMDRTETSTATLAAGLCKDMGLAVKADLRVFGAPKSTEEKADNFHVSGYARIYAAVEENITVKGVRITPATVAALRDRNVEGKTLLQGIPKSVSDATNWNGQIKLRIKTLRAACERHLAIKPEGGAGTVNTPKGEVEKLMEHIQKLFNASQKEGFSAADAATFAAWAQQGAAMIGGKIKVAK
jgi:hypothetical protein